MLYLSIVKEKEEKKESKKTFGFTPLRTAVLSFFFFLSSSLPLPPPLSPPSVKQRKRRKTSEKRENAIENMANLKLGGPWDFIFRSHATHNCFA
jgi:hypothetical protein